MASNDDRQDEQQGEKKRGLFSRLFGRKPASAPADEQALSDIVPADEQAVADGPPQDEATVEAAIEAAIEAAPVEKATPAPAPTEAEPKEPEEPEAQVEVPVTETQAAETQTAEAIEPPADDTAAQDAEPDEAQAEAEAPVKSSWWRKLKDGLSRTSSSIGSGITSIFTHRKLDDATLEDLEDILIQADLGVAMATRVTEAVGKGRYDKSIAADEVKTILSREIESVLTPVAQPLVIDTAQKPFVILMIGVNGAGKTTTIGKLAAKFRAEGRSVMLAAGDTFRAAAIEQLVVWGERTGARVIRGEQGADAAGLAYDALQQAQESGTDVLLVDTAGRLQNKAGLMAELEKVIRVIKKRDETAPHATLLVLDATTGQNAVNQVDIFAKMAGVTGLVMTKLDGTARGGILVAIADKFGLPVHFIGVGEGVDDLEPFTADDFARAIAGIEDERV